MGVNDDKIISAVYQAKLLTSFKKFCDRLSASGKEYRDVKSILHVSNNKADTLRKIFRSRLEIELSEDDAGYMLELVEAFFDKISARKPIGPDVRTSLLNKQKYKCAFCGAMIDEHDPVDHIVPFKYVGDELKNNYQILCKSCNSRKRESMDYQIKVLLNYMGE